MRTIIGDAETQTSSSNLACHRHDRYNTRSQVWRPWNIKYRVERDEYRGPETYAVREQFSLFLICWVEREKLLFLLFQSGFDDAMNMENDNINNSLECLEMSWNDLNIAKLRCWYIIFNLHSSVSLEMSTWEQLRVGTWHQPQCSLPSPCCLH